MISHLVSATDLRLTVNTDDSSELHKAMVIKYVTYAEVIAVTSKIVPLVHIDAIPLVGNNLETQSS